MAEIVVHRYDNGLTLLVEPIAGMASCSMSWLLPAGVVDEPADQLGLGAVLDELIWRGAGDLDAKAHSEALDQLGVQRDSYPQTHHFRLDATVLPEHLTTALSLLFDVIDRPHLTASALEPSRQLAIQAIESLADEPQQQVMIDLKKIHLGLPLGRSAMGEIQTLQALTIDQVRAYCRERFCLSGSILSFAGQVDPAQVIEWVGQRCDQWAGVVGSDSKPTNVLTPTPPTSTYVHVPSETAQQHIGVAYRSLPEADERSMVERLATAVLSGGMSGRLFTEVREKRGLCYSVYASYAAGRESGVVYSYAGTTSERAQETLDVLIAELDRLGQGVSQSEYDRAVIGLKSRVVMSGESTAARASSLAMDQVLRGAPRSLEQMEQAIEAVSLSALNDYLAERAQGQTPYTVVSVGPSPLSVTMA